MKEAIAYIEQHFSDRFFDGNFEARSAQKKALKAMGKQIAKRPHPKEKYNSGYAMYCPTCNNFICLEPNERDILPASIANAYCRRCGQALDWEGTISGS